MRKPAILIVEDNEAELFGYRQFLSKQDYAVSTAETLEQARSELATNHFEAVLLDLRLPDGDGADLIKQIQESHPTTAIIVVSGISEIATAVEVTKEGADNYLTKPIKMDNLLVTLKKSIELEGLRRRDLVQKRLSQKTEPVFGESEIIQQTLNFAKVAASSDTVILLQGETGSGKGILAKWIHDKSTRNTESFVELNCSSLKGELLRSELFGHTKGAFTSAIKDRPGLVEIADHGTLFLDEIGDMDLDVQAQLLKTIEERTFRRVGENRLRTSDFRLICATNHNLLEATETKKFRKDLYYRICVFPITIPPLRHRSEDINGIISHLLKELGYTRFPLSASVLDLLRNYTWPGNIRELRNMLERALLLAKDSPLSTQHFPGLSIEEPSMPLPSAGGELSSLKSAEAQHIVSVLHKLNGDKSSACKELGISLSSLYRKLAKIKEFA